MRFRVLLAKDALTPLQLLVKRRWRPQWVCQSCRSVQQPRRSIATTTTVDASEKPYYVTTPIFYVNAAPHVGHMYTMILADVLKRWQELKGRKAVLLTGTDEHGMKIQRAAAKANIEPKEFCDSGAEVFKALAGHVHMSNDVFIRTTDKNHVQGVEYAWQMLQERGYIYESKHEGWYSVSDETFYPQKQVHLILDPPTGRKIMASIETGKEVEWTSERNYHFRLSAFRDRLLAFYRSNTDYIVPAARMEDVVRQVEAGIEDLSISRPAERLTWGIPVPTDPSQTIYVWLDALFNYATAVGYPFTPGQEAKGGWPADVQVVGKDIIRFHCIYWPAFLMALDLPLHKQVLTHAHWTIGKQKMAKSTGTGVNPFFALERFGIDAMRWFLIHDGGIENDADYDNSFIIAKYKKGLQGGLGNLVFRVMSGKTWNVPRAVKRYAPVVRDEEASRERQHLNESSKEYLRKLEHLPHDVDKQMTLLRTNLALRLIMRKVQAANAYFQSVAPWTPAKQIAQALKGGSLTTDSRDGQTLEEMEAEVDRTVYLMAETLRIVGILLQPFMPAAADRQLNMLGVAKDRRGFEWARVGKDDSFGVPLEEIHKGDKGLFPQLTSDY